MLIVFSGLPGTGKTTIASNLAARLGAVYLRIDSIEQAVRDADVLKSDVGRSGYLAANALALSNLRIGNRVIVDCVNPVLESRQAWKKVATDSGVPLLDIEVVCSDIQEHKRRVESRTSDIKGLIPPTWQSVLLHDFEPWDSAPFRLDTALVCSASAVAIIVQHLTLQALTPDPFAIEVDA